MTINRNLINVDDIDPVLLNSILKPYKDECRYLKKARLQRYPADGDDANPSKNNKNLWFIQGDFSIPESCYISDTGHFNSVEFNICYNQLAYVIVAYLLESHLLEVMSDWDLESYKRRQLSDCLIVKFNSTFKKPINSNYFQGTLSIDKCAARRQLIILNTSCAFYDDQGGWSDGNVTLAILNGKVETIGNSHHKSKVA